jgi:hypothetical protein
LYFFSPLFTPPPPLHPQTPFQIEKTTADEVENAAVVDDTEDAPAAEEQDEGASAEANEK